MVREGLHCSLYLDFGTRASAAGDDGGVVELIREDEAALAHQRRDASGVGRKSHTQTDRILLAHKGSDCLLQLNVQWSRACSSFISQYACTACALQLSLACLDVFQPTQPWVVHFLLH